MMPSMRHRQRGAIPEFTERVLGAVEEGRDELVQSVSTAVRIPSVNPRYPGQTYHDVVGGEREVSRFLAGIYAELGAGVDVFGLEPGRENAVALIDGDGDGRSLIYNGHVDVVPPGRTENWRHDPFSGLIDADRIWARSSTDMRAERSFGRH